MFRPPATRTTARLPLRKTVGLVPLIGTPAVRVTGAAAAVGTLAALANSAAAA